MDMGAMKCMGRKRATLRTVVSPPPCTGINQTQVVNLG